MTDTRVNTHTNGYQGGQQVTALAGGGWVVTWQSDGQDGSSYGVYQQAYDADGVAVGGEVRVNTTTDNTQSGPQVTALAGGGWVVTWQSDGQDGSSTGVYQQAYDADGGTVGGEVQVNTFTSDYQGGPQVTALAGGGWVVTWQSWNQDGSGSGVYQQAYDAAGGTVGSEVRVNTYTTGSQSSPQVTALAGGGWVVTWQSNGQDGSGWGVYQQAYDADGVAVGSEVRVNTFTNSDQFGPQVTALAGGGWVVTWQSNGQDGSGSGVYQQAYDADGGTVGGEVQVNTFTSDYQGGPQVTALAGGGWVVTWQSNGQDGSSYGVYQQAYDADGVAVGSEVRVNTFTNSDQYNPQVTALAGGGWVVTWTSYQDGSEYGVYQQVYDAAGGAIGGETRVNTYIFSNQQNPQITALTGGGWVVTWTSTGQDGSGDGVYQTVFAAPQVGDGDANTLTGGEASDTLVGLGGDDTLVAGNGVNTLVGGDGDDTLQSGTTDRSLFDGGAGTDHLILDRSLFGSGLSFSLASGSATLGDGSSLVGIERLTFTGTAFNDSVTGGSLDDTLFGGGGNDTLNGGAGNDTLDGGEGNDSLSGGDGHDALDGGDGHDSLNAGAGNNTVNGGDGEDTIFMNDDGGVHAIDGGSGTDRLVFNRASSTLDWVFDFRTPSVSQTLVDGTTLVNVERATLTLGSGNDTVHLSAPGSTVYGGGGNDTLRAVGVTDVYLYGGDGNDTLELSGTVAGSRFMNGDTGDDTLISVAAAGSGGTLLISGGDGIDTAVIDRSLTTRSIVVDLGDPTLQTALGDGTILENVERLVIATGSGNDQLTGGVHADTLSGGAGRDLIDGGAGDDIIDGGAGTDILDGGAGNDIINGGAGVDIIDGGEGLDTVTFTGALGAVIVDRGNSLGSRGDAYGDVYVNVERFELTAFADEFRGIDDAEEVRGGAGNDTLDGGAGHDTLYGEAGHDRLIGGAGYDILDGGAGDDEIHGDAGNDYLYGRDGSDTLYGGDGIDRLYGGNGSDTLDGGAGDDLMYGDAAADDLYGRDGNDTLYGGEGIDRVYGGAGHDIVDAGVGDDLVHGDDGHDYLYGRDGHDVIYGGTGNDRLYGGNGYDILDGGVGDDRLFGEASADYLYGRDGNDQLYGGGGNDVLYGGNGTDGAYFTGLRSEYTVVTVGNFTTVSHLGGSGADGTDRVYDVELLVFSDETIIL